MTQSTRDIRRNGMTVSCWGTWKEDSNALCVGEYADGSELEEFFCDGATCWADAVEQITRWAKAHGHEVVQMEAC